MTPEELSDMYNAPALPFDPVTGQATHQEPQPYEPQAAPPHQAPYPPPRQPAPYPDLGPWKDERERERERELDQREHERQRQRLAQEARLQHELERERQEHSLAVEAMRHEAAMLQIRQAEVPVALAGHWNEQRAFLIGVLAGAAVSGLVFWSQARR